ncbi:MAG: nucleosome binding factor SPN SPT16 subunit [Candidatus Latescibacterota bacterium]|jgi:nucleosome binding factor SPN SPT16 subunit
MAKNKTFDAIEMVRRIRDDHHEQLKSKTVKERLAFYRNKSSTLRSTLKNK